MSNCNHQIATTEDGLTFKIGFKSTEHGFEPSAKCKHCGQDLTPYEIRELVGVNLEVELDEE